MKMSSKQFTSISNSFFPTTKTILHFVSVLFTIVTDKEVTANCYGSWMKNVNVNDSVFHNVLFSSTEIHNFDCAKKCWINEFCTYYGFDETDSTCKGFSERGSVINTASNLQIWQKSCGSGYENMTEPAVWCIKAYAELMIRDEAALFCAMKKSRLAVVNSEDKKTFATKYLKAFLPGAARFFIGLINTWTGGNDTWFWDTGEFLNTSLSWANVNKQVQNPDCAVMWDGDFLDVWCHNGSFVLCEEL